MSNNTSLLSVWPVLLQLRAFGNCELLAAPKAFGRCNFAVGGGVCTGGVCSSVFPGFHNSDFVARAFCTGLCTGGICTGFCTGFYTGGLCTGFCTGFCTSGFCTGAFCRGFCTGGVCDQATAPRASRSQWRSGGRPVNISLRAAEFKTSH